MKKGNLKHFVCWPVVLILNYLICIGVFLWWWTCCTKSYNILMSVSSYSKCYSSQISFFLFYFTKADDVWLVVELFCEVNNLHSTSKQAQCKHRQDYNISTNYYKCSCHKVNCPYQWISCLYWRMLGVRYNSRVNGHQCVVNCCGFTRWKNDA